ncbi:MAG: tight adherence protein B [Planctomycetota bacterium]|jgi:tight adherence protein B
MNFDLLIIINVALYLSVFLLVFLALYRGGSVGGRFLGRYESSLQFELNRLFVRNMTARNVIALGGLCGIMLAFLVWLKVKSVPFGVLVFVGSQFLPLPVLRNYVAKRLEKVREQLPSAVDSMASAAPNFGLPDVIKEASHLSPNPIGQELRQVSFEYDVVKIDVETALLNARKRLQLSSFNLVASALVINNQKGGNLSRALATMSGSLREILKLENKVITASSEGRKAARVISAMPILLFFFISSFQPDLIDTLTGSFTGWVMLALSVTLYSFGAIWMYRMLKVDV